MNNATAFRTALALHQAGRLDDACKIYEEIIAGDQDHFKSLHHLGIVALQQGNYLEAVRQIDNALRLNPNQPLAHNNRGAALRALKRNDEALASFEHALALDPNHAEAHCNRARMLIDFCLFDQAVANCDRAVALKPDYVDAHDNRGVALHELGRHEEAIASFDQVIALRPHRATAYAYRGACLSALKRHREAIASYSNAIACTPDIDFVPGAVLFLTLEICDWNGIDDKFTTLLNQVDAGRLVSTPPLLLPTPSSAAQQQKIAARYFQERTSSPISNPPDFRNRHGDKIHIGYFSTDFHDHAIAILIAGLLETHDRSQFEITGFLLARRPIDAAQLRLKTAMDRFIDVSDMSDQQVAKLSRELKIDIAVDLNGYTANSRPGIFTQRAAPIQVNYLGYPGTMGTTCIDYIVADQVVIPPHIRPYFTEKVTYLPHSYQANDSKRPIPHGAPSRTELGLPESGFVFCCFNNSYKLTPDVFDIWVRLLGSIDGSTLWLLGENETMTGNLRAEARKRGIPPDRLVFAKRMAQADHLARHGAADLFLDTFYYGAHTTASDALWAGLPVLTKLGNTFASRVAASLLTAVGMPELIAEDAAAYERIALELATRPEKLARLKQRLLENGASSPLFDTPRFTRNIEAAFRRMWETYNTKGMPEDFHVEEA